MLKAFRSILACLLAFLVLASSTSFTVGIHSCMGRVQNVAIFSDAFNCPMKTMPPCGNHVKRSCCNSNTVVHEGKTFDNGFVPVDLSAASALHVFNNAVLLSSIIPPASSTSAAFTYDPPPLPSPDLVIALQTLLI